MPTATLSRRRAIGNLAAQRQGIPTTQAGVDALWGGIVTRLNATLPPAPALASTPSPRPARALQGQADADDMWSSIAADLNKQAGLAPTRSRAR